MWRRLREKIDKIRIKTGKNIIRIKEVKVICIFKYVDPFSTGEYLAKGYDHVRQPGKLYFYCNSKLLVNTKYFFAVKVLIFFNEKHTRNLFFYLSMNVDLNSRTPDIQHFNFMSELLQSLHDIPCSPKLILQLREKNIERVWGS